MLLCPYSHVLPFYPLTYNFIFVGPNDLCIGMFQGTTRQRGGWGLSRRAGRQTQSCGSVRCNSKPRGGRVTATTELLVDETLLVDDEG